MDALEGIKTDIPSDIAYRAHCGTSYSPELRAVQEINAYIEQLTEDYESLSKYATTPEKLATLAAEFKRYRAKYRDLYTASLIARASVLSPMITGGSNFPVRRNQKRGSTYERRLAELRSFRERAIAAITKSLRDVICEVDRIKSQIAELEQCIGTVRATSNTRPKIRRLRARLEKLEQDQATPETEILGELATFSDSPADNRVRLFYPGKPSPEIRAALKSTGFRWSPSIGAWQAYRNERTITRAKQFAGVHE